MGSAWDTLVRDDATALVVQMPDPIVWPRAVEGLELPPDVPSPVGFDEEHHIYTIDGVRIPSVTTVIDGLVDYSMIPPLQLKWAADRGSAAHRAIELWDHHVLDVLALDERLAPYLDAWRAFCRESGWQTLRSEVRVYHPLYRYCGTLDKVGHLPGEPLGILDIKTTAVLHVDYCAIQTVGYQRAYNEANEERAKRRYALQLRPDGRYQLEEFTQHMGDWQRFREHLARYTGERK